ncbi:MAG TPA: glycine zipper 2TM domain-containing protein [Casimicrobiaceae bacterium]|nr:glycine zipper 2TM domain-containing protein [Casimicrobiaceae bacterium]
MMSKSMRAWAAIAAAGVVSLAAPAWAQTRCNHDCGVVQSVRHVEKEGEASGLGAVAGGVVGGVLGHQIGSGRGNTVATVAGAAGGAYAGHEIEKSRNKKAYWSVAIKMDSGNVRTFTYGSKPAVREGERVKLIDGGKRLALVTG